MTKEDLFYSIGDIDDKYVAEADRPYIGLMPRLVKYGSIAASLIIVITISFTLAFQLLLGKAAAEDNASGGDMMSGDAIGGSPNQNGTTNSGAELKGIYTADGATLCVDDIDGGVFTLSLTLTEDIAKINVSALLEKDGVTHASTTDPESDIGYPLLTAPIIRVNGTITNKIPTEAGEYSLTVDFSEIIREGYEITELTLTPFGTISLE